MKHLFIFAAIAGISLNAMESPHGSVAAEPGSPKAPQTTPVKVFYSGPASLPTSSSSDSVKLDVSHSGSSDDALGSPRHKNFRAFVQDVQKRSKRSEGSDSPTDSEQAANDLMTVYDLLSKTSKERRKSLAGLMFALNSLEPTIAQQYLVSKVINRDDIVENPSLINLLGSIARCSNGQAAFLLERLFPDEKPDVHEVDKHKKEAESISSRERTGSQESGGSVGAVVRSEWAKRKKTLLASAGLFVVGFGSNLVTYFVGQLNTSGSINQCNSDLTACQSALSACRFPGS